MKNFLLFLTIIMGVAIGGFVIVRSVSAVNDGQIMIDESN